MKGQWEIISAKVLAMSQRERIMVVAAMLAVLWILFDTVLLTPLGQKRQIYLKEISTYHEDITKAQVQQAAIFHDGQVDPDAGTKAQLAKLQQQMQQMDADLRATQSQLVTPDRMPKVLQSLLQTNRQIKLVALNTLPVAGLMDGIASGKESASPAFGIYKHGFEVTLEGSYLDLMHYVAALESSPWHMLWSNITLQSSGYPQSTLKLTLYTLSLDQAWLSI